MQPIKSSGDDYEHSPGVRRLSFSNSEESLRAGDAGLMFASALGDAGTDAGSGDAGASRGADSGTDAGRGDAGAGRGADAGTDAGRGDAGAGRGADAGTDAGTAVGGSTCGELPTFTVSSPVPVDERADSIAEFVNNLSVKLGGDPHMQPRIGWALELDARGRVTKTNLTLDTKIIRPRWAGGRPSDSDRTLIGKCVEMIKSHEERHRRYC